MRLSVRSKRVCCEWSVPLIKDSSYEISDDAVFEADLLGCDVGCSGWQVKVAKLSRGYDATAAGPQVGELALTRGHSRWTNGAQWKKGHGKVSTIHDMPCARIGKRGGGHKGSLKYRL